jgi:hypothetical protein
MTSGLALPHSDNIDHPMLPNPIGNSARACLPRGLCADDVIKQTQACMSDQSVSYVFEPH